MMTWVVFGLMAGALLSAFRAVTLVVLARDAMDGSVCEARRYVAARSAALRWAVAAAGWAVVLALGGLWRVAQAVTR